MWKWPIVAAASSLTALLVIAAIVHMQHLNDPQWCVDHATSAVLVYQPTPVPGLRIELTQEEFEQLRDAFRIRRIGRNAGMTEVPYVRVEFCGPFGVRQMNVGNDSLNDRVGVIYVDEAFYDQTSQLLSKHLEKRPGWITNYFVEEK